MEIFGNERVALLMVSFKLLIKSSLGLQSKHVLTILDSYFKLPLVPHLHPNDCKEIVEGATRKEEDLLLALQITQLSPNLHRICRSSCFL